MNIRLEQVLPADIERRSMEIIESELPHPIDPALAPIIKRVVHTSADFDYVDNLCFSENVVEKALHAIRAGADAAGGGASLVDHDLVDLQVSAHGVEDRVARAARQRLHGAGVCGVP